MITVGFVVTPGFPVMSLAALSVFEFANIESDHSIYEVTVLSEHGGAVPTTMGTTLNTVPFGDVHFDTLLIGGNTRVTPTSPALRAFVVEASKLSRRVCSICTGVFALGDANLLDGKRVTTHWAFTHDFKRRFPSARLDENRLFVVDGPIWTAAGNSAGLDLTLWMLENDYGSELARTVARTLVVDQQRSGGQSQHSALLELNPKSDRIQDALAYARLNLKAALSVELLAGVARLGPRQFSRALRSETGMSPAKAIESLRLDAARLMIETSRHTIDVIAAETGFGDQERMRRAFVRVHGQPPQVIRRMAQSGVARR
jgi:transcriptional regulator GlxA family with amidase domain